MTQVIRFFSFFAFLFPGLLLAQSPDSLITDRAARLSEVVIQSSRAGVNHPVPHYNLKAAAIRKNLHAQDVPYLLSGTPSLVENSDAGTGIGYTGLRIRGSDPTRVNVTINGVPLNDSESQGVFWVNLPDLAASASEIQVQRGVGASTNGAGAFGATVNLDLSNIQSEAGGGIAATLGAFGTRRLSVQANTGLLQGKWAFSGRASTIHSDGYIDRAKADMQSLHFTGAYLGDRHTLQGHLLLGKEITYQAWNGVPAQYLSDPALRTFNTAGTERPGTPYEDEIDHYNQHHLLLHYKLALSPAWMLQINGHYTKGFGYYEQYKADQSFAGYGLTPLLVADTVIEETDLIRRRWLDNDFYGGAFVLRQATTHRSATLGGALSRYEGRHFGEIIWSEWPVGNDKDFRYYDNTAEKLDGNLYLKVDQTLFNKLTAYIDLQGRVVDYQFQGFNQDLQPAPQAVRHFFFNPKIGATWNASPQLAAYAFFGIAHREPNRDDYTQSSPESRPKAERLNDLEAGVRYTGDKAAFSANLFYMHYKNQLVLDGRINDVGAYIRTNVPDSYRAGIELEGAFKPISWLGFTGNLALSQNRVNTFVEYRDNWDTWGQEIIQHRNTSLAFSPSVVARLESNVTLLKWGNESIADGRFGQISMAITGKYVGKQYLDNTGSTAASLPGYWVSDLRINADISNFFGRETSLILSCNNWLDARYSANGWVYRFVSAGYDPRPDDPYAVLDGGDVYQLAGYFPQAGRHWMATFRVAF